MNDRRRGGRLSRRLQTGYCVWLASLLSGMLPLYCDGAEGVAPSIAIQAQPLDTALRIFALQTGLQLVYVTDLTRGLNTRGCSAAGTPADALTQLLAGTGLSFDFINGYTVQIRVSVPGSSRDTTDLSGVAH